MSQYRISLMIVLSIGLVFAGGLVYAGQEETQEQPVQEKIEKKARVELSINGFFEKARFIMTDDEKEIYKNLATDKDRIDFIKEFWEKRDPTPFTEENESFMEFQERINYANKWFKEGSKGRGWDTERGRILLQLGFPDRREFGEATDVVRSGRASNLGRMLSSKRIPMEIWTYYSYSLRLVFSDTEDKGRLNMTRIPANLITTMDLVRSRLYLTNPDIKFKEKKSKKKNQVQAVFNEKSSHIDFKIPIDQVSFEETADKQKMVTTFDIQVYVYFKNKKIEQIKLEKIVEKSKDELLNMESLDLSFPYSPIEKGKYFFDVIVRERMSGIVFRKTIKLAL